jgi:cytochrome P450
MDPHDHTTPETFSFRLPGYIRNPYSFYPKFLSELPFFFNSQDNCYVVSRFDDVKHVLQEYKTFGSGSGVIPMRRDNPDDFGFNPIFMLSPPEQTRLRKLSANAFSIAYTTSLQREISDIAISILNDIERGSIFDLVERYATRLTVLSLLRVISVSDQDTPYVCKLVMDIINGNDYSSNQDTAFMKDDPPALALTKFLSAHIDRVRATRNGGFSAKLLDADIAGDRLTANELYGMFFVSLIAGTEDTIRAFANVLLALWQHPDQKHMVLQDMDNLLADSIFEALRLYPTTHYLRRVVETDCILCDTPVARGASVVAVIGAANRDERQFNEPNRFDIRRGNSRSSLSFGTGPHVCIGKNVARLILTVGISEFLKKFPTYEIDLASSRNVSRAMIIGYGNMPVHLPS